MDRHKWRVIGLGAVILGCAATLLYVGAPLQYYAHVPGVRQLPPDLIEAAFRLATGRELPACARDLRGIISGGMDPAIFIRFQTDSKGIEHIVNVFSGSDVASIVLDPNDPHRLLPSGCPLFFGPSYWQERLGISLFDRELAKSGRMLEYLAQPGNPDGYQIFIDDEDAIVYVFAYHI